MNKGKRTDSTVGFKKNRILQMKSSLDGIRSRLDNGEEKVKEFKYTARKLA